MKPKKGQNQEKNRIETMYQEYFTSLMVIACSYTHDRTEAEDLVQDVFVKALLSYRAGGSFLYWANRVLRNDFYNLVKKKRRIAEEPFDLLRLQSQDDLLSDYIQNEERARLAAMISMLPMKYRQVMIDSVYLQLENREIAAAYSISEENVRQIKSRARKMLIQMKEEEDERDRKRKRT